MASPSTTILSLPFDIILNIVQYLPLKDALHFSTISNTAFDAVYYTFAHNEVVNFQSCLNTAGTIDLTDEEILQVLHAHTRAIELQNFALPETFTSFHKLDEYFWTYVCWEHPTAQLMHIQYPKQCISNKPLHKGELNSFGTLANILDIHDKYGVLLDTHCFFPQPSWSNKDLDEPYESWYFGISSLLDDDDELPSFQDIREIITYKRNTNDNY